MLQSCEAGEDPARNPQFPTGAPSRAGFALEDALMIDPAGPTRFQRRADPDAATLAELRRRYDSGEITATDIAAEIGLSIGTTRKRLIDWGWRAKLIFYSFGDLVWHKSLESLMWAGANHKTVVPRFHQFSLILLVFLPL